MKSKPAFLVISLSLVLAACSDENSKVRGEFLAGCAQGGTSKDSCLCVFEKLENIYSTAELQQMDRAYPPDQRFVKNVFKFAFECQSE